MIQKYILILFLLFASQVAGAVQIGDVITNRDGSKGVVFHAVPGGFNLIVALNDAVASCQWGDTNTDLNIGTLTTKKNIWDYNGSLNTTFMQQKQNPSMGYAASYMNFDGFTGEGWFIPSDGEWLMLLGAWGIISPIVKANGGTDFIANEYWTSSEKDQAFARMMILNYRSIYNSAKNNNAAVRAIGLYQEPQVTYDPTLSYLWNTGNTDPYITVSPAQTTTYTVTATSSAGCGATASKTIIVNNVSGQTITDSICQGQTYTKHGFTETAAGTYNRTITQGSCSAPITLNLKVNPTYQKTFQDNICLGKSYTGNGLHITPTQSGNFSQTFYYASLLGCDSTVTVKLDVKPSYETKLYDTICVNNAYTKNDFSLPVQSIPGTHSYSRSLKTKTGGCDSIIVLNLWVNKKIENIISDQVCPNKAYNRYNFNIAPQTLGTTVTDTKHLVSKVTGCDSTVTLNLQVTNTITKIIDKDICAGGSYFFKGKNMTVAGTYKDTLMASGGCDSIVTLNLTLRKPDKTDLHDTIYLNNAYNKNGFSLPIQSAVNNIIKTLNLHNRYGCDSIVTLNLSVRDYPANPPCDVKLSTIIDPSSKNNNLFGVNNFTNGLPLTDCLGNYSITIFNRYGQLITTVGTEGWNGRVRGKPADAGVYYYVLEYTSGNEKKQLKGTVEVIKK